MFAAPSAGALVVSATSGWMPRVRRHGLAIAIAAACWGLSMGMVGLAPSVWVALVFLAVAGGADECSGVFRDAMWKQSIPDQLRGRMAGIELLSYAASAGRAAPLGRGRRRDRPALLAHLGRARVRGRGGGRPRRAARLPALPRPVRDRLPAGRRLAGRGLAGRGLTRRGIAG